MNELLNQIIKAVNSAETILVTSHVSPDADAYGSSIGLTLALKKIGKQVECFNVDGVSSRYDCIPAMEQVIQKLPDRKFDLLIACDCGSLQRIGDAVYNILPAAAKLLISIDHHASNTNFGQINYVISTASSTAELIYLLLEQANWSLDQDIATCLLAGIYGDTGGLRYSSTSAETFRIASKLIAAGAVPHKIATDLFSRKTWGAFKLQALVNASATLFANNKAVYAVVSAEDYQNTNTDPELTEGFVEGLRDIDGVQVACFIYWHSDLWKVSLRAKADNVHVNMLAEKFGGGGHTKAAAFRYRSSLDNLLQALLPEIEKLV